jgi:DNA invertase Pin-like site-specific DNA recombinase
MKAMTPPLPTAYPAAYLRRSSATSRNPGDNSREGQEASVRRMAGESVRLYVDWGISGRKADRPEYQRLKADIRAGHVSSLCAYSLSRLGRSTRELLDLVELCKAHGVSIRTETEAINTDGAMGGFMLTIMAAVGQLEAEMGQERAKTSRAARRERHIAAGIKDGPPPSIARYGTRHVTEDGITRIVKDPERIAPVLAAYRKAGSVRGACEELQRQGIPAPRGGLVWGSSALARILQSYIPEEMPTANPRGLRRPAGRVPALFAGLMACHCGATMTPNAKRGQYYCAHGRDSGTALHGRYSVTERALRDALEPEAAKYTTRRLTLSYKSGVTDAERAHLEDLKRRALDRNLEGAMSDAEYRSRTAVLDAKLADIARKSAAVDRISLERVPEWSEVAAMQCPPAAHLDARHAGRGHAPDRGVGRARLHVRRGRIRRPRERD